MVGRSHEQVNTQIYHYRDELQTKCMKVLCLDGLTKELSGSVESKIKPLASGSDCCARVTP